MHSRTNRGFCSADYAKPETCRTAPFCSADYAKPDICRTAFFVLLLGLIERNPSAAAALDTFGNAAAAESVCVKSIVLLSVTHYP